MHNEHKLLSFLKTPKVIFILFLVNLLGSIYGFYWYRDQLAQTPAFLWPFVPDSPTATALFTIVLLLYIVKAPKTLFTLISCAWLIKYGIWAGIINTHFLIIGGDYTFTNFHLTISHLGMAAEGIVFSHGLSISKSHGILLLTLLAISDIIDYTLNVHPWLFDASQYYVALISAVLLTVIIGLSVVISSGFKKT
ncbi:MAG: DUF1405 domain-containing protein [Tepidanaerobacteraceae bacterium]|jgi:uncharacterized membrane protein YpjA